MKRKSKIFLGVLSIFTAGIVTGICLGLFFAHHRIASFKKMDYDQRRNVMMDRIFGRMELSEQQQQEIRSLVTSMQQEFSLQHEKCKQLSQEQKQLIEAEIFNETLFREKLKQVSIIKEDTAVQQALIKRQIRVLLNDEQKDMFDSYFKNFRGPFGSSHGKGKGRGGQCRH